MKIVRLKDLEGTEREVKSPAGWTSVRFLLAQDGMGFSMHETTFPPGLEFDMWYKHHLEAVYCYQGTGEIINRDTGEKFAIEPGTLYALDKRTGATRWRVEGVGHVTSEAVPHGDRIYVAERGDISGYWSDDEPVTLHERGRAYSLVQR